MTVQVLIILVWIGGERTHAVGSFKEELQVLWVGVGLFIAEHAFNVVLLVVESHGLSAHAGCCNQPYGVSADSL